MPPPSTLQGVLRAALGQGPADPLPELFLSARPLKLQRSLFQTTNYLFIKEGRREELRGLYKEGRTQIPVQFLVGEEGVPLAFEVFVASEDLGLIEKLVVAMDNPAYPLSLGPAFALAWAEELALLEGELQKGWRGEGIGWWEVSRLQLKNLPVGLRLYRDRFPVAIEAGRVPTRVEELALEMSGAQIPVIYEGEVLRIGEQAVGVVRA